MRTIITLTALSLVGCGQAELGPCGHAHNDYEHARPLLDALENRMCSVEADVFLSGGELYVAHEEESIESTRTLQSLYLDPLRSGASTEPLYLFIDVKSDGAATYAVLHDVLSTYDDILTQWDDGFVTERLVTAVISGDRDRSTMQTQGTRYAAMDGRLVDLEMDPSPSTALIPIISDNWRTKIIWVGGDSLPDEKRALLDGFVQKAHEQGRMIRFWGPPETPTIWNAQRDAGVDLINTDDLSGLSAVLGD